MKNILTLLSIFLFLFLSFYSVFYPTEEVNRYRNKDGRLLRWSSSGQSCNVEIDSGILIEGSTPMLGTDKNGMNYAFYISKSFNTNLLLAFLSVIAFILISVSSGIFIGYDTQHRKLTLSNTSNGLSAILNKNNTGVFLRFVVDSVIRTLHAIPQLLLLIIVVVVSYSSLENDLTRMYVVMVFIGVLSAPKLVFLIVDRIALLEADEFINAARASGLADSIIIFKHILFYDSSPVIFAQIIYVFVQATMLETVISFLGYGMGMSQSSIGGLITQYRYDLPGSVGGDMLALYPMIVLLLIALAGNNLTKSFMEMRSD
jgi:ABC-type dipeptide/oligopeptide/nickel transport system permease subunit